MTPSITLTDRERNTLLDYYRSAGHDHELRLRSHIILLLAAGRAWATIAAVLFCSSRTIARWKARFERGRLAGLLSRPHGPAPGRSAGWAALVVRWVTELTPRAFGFLRGRWCCEAVVPLLWRARRLEVSRETVRRWLRRADIVWRRPRPVLRRTDPRKAAIFEQLRALLRGLPDDETVVFQDEVDINLNPKIGCMWMRRGQQAEIGTPGDNVKCYLAGSLHWRTGALIATEGPRRDGRLFVRHPEDLRRRLRRYRVIHVICDNAKFHYDSRVLWEFLHEHGGRVRLHFLPKYAPELNPIERIWWALHEAITRNHQCGSLPALVDLVFAWLSDRQRFKVEDAAYHDAAAAT